LRSLEENIEEVLAVGRRLGLTNTTPIVLSDAGNLTVHLAPYSIVARIVKLFPGDNPYYWREVWARELRVVHHLITRGVPVVPFTTIVPPGPHQVGDTWMTLWEYVSPASLPTLSGKHAIDMINKLTGAMADFQEPLPTLGVWKNVSKAVENLRSITDKGDHIADLLLAFEQVDEKMKSYNKLFPAHGDAHPRNLIASSTGWRWIDFEDVSLMPQFWDFASFIGNTALFHGLKHPIVEYVLSQNMIANDKPAFQFALRARVIMSTTTNLSLALVGHGDLDFAHSQLERINDFLALLDKGL
jgi:hypothetical protein